MKKPASPRSSAKVGIIMGSESDHETMRAAEAVLRDFGVPYEIAVVSAHRTPERMFDWAKSAKDRGLEIVIAGAGGAAHLPGMVASLTPLPVLGVPVQSKALSGLDSLLSIVQMPSGIPTATFAIGTAGAANAALFAVRMLALRDAGLARRLDAFRDGNVKKVLEMSDRVQPKSEKKRR